jgi:predicted nucleic acid-binding protein
MLDKVFIDTNIWIYLFANEDNQKHLISKNFISENATNTTFVISWQVLNEVSTVLKRKNFTENDIRSAIEHILTICVVQNFTKEILYAASFLREKHSFSFWDSLIIASAAAANCISVISEDMQNNRQILGLTIKAIF